MFEMWLAGFLMCLGIWWVWKSEWHIDSESKLKYLLRVIAICSLSWLCIGIVIGRIAWALRDRDRFPGKGEV